MKGLIFICLMATTALSAQSEGIPVELSLRECETMLGVTKRDTTAVPKRTYFENSGTGTVSLSEGEALSINSDVVFISSSGILSTVFVPDTIKSLSFGPGAGEGPVLEFGLNADETWRNEIWFKTGSDPKKNSLVLSVGFSDTSIKSAFISLYERETWDSAGDCVFISSIKDGCVKVTSIKALKPNKEYLAVITTQKED